MKGELNLVLEKSCYKLDCLQSVMTIRPTKIVTHAHAQRMKTTRSSLSTTLCRADVLFKPLHPFSSESFCIGEVLGTSYGGATSTRVNKYLQHYLGLELNYLLTTKILSCT